MLKQTDKLSNQLHITDSVQKNVLISKSEMGHL